MAIKFNQIDQLLQQDFTIETSKELANNILALMGINDTNFIYTQNSLRKITDTSKKSMFVDDNKFADFKAAYDITNSHFDINVKHKQLILPRLFVIKQYSRSNIIWLNKLGINYEDEPQLNGFYPLGLDFIVCQNRFLVVISNQDNLRVLELNQGEELNSTQLEILSSWQNLFTEESNKKLLHSKLWDSLNLESVNKKFYIDIIQNFANLKQHLIENKHFDNNQAVIFTNRLIGRLLFCYFLIKKSFIPTEYLELNQQNDNDYYHKKLSQLFFAVLNTPINERNHDDRSTPYLNGGLFERKDTDIDNVTFPNNYFNGLFAIFRKYNWTVDESLSNYEVMAIDPEMLGRIFENLLAEINVDNDGSSESARKAKGAFYTPRVIVDYMCKESLRQCLHTNSPEHSHNIINRLLDDSIGYLTDQKKNWTDDVKPYKEHLISLLDKITVFDPACGSGAFPMGMLQLILHTYERLGDKQKPSNRKIKIIENSIFGADIEPNAIEIARLRAWLSIIVDEDKQDIEPLPNLDFKFVCCNSLIKLETKGQSNLADNMDTVEKLQELQHDYFNARSYEKKHKLRQQYHDLIEQSRTQNSLFGKSKYLEQIESYHPFDTTNVCQFYDNQFMFGISDGFDVVIGNPPYIDSEQMTRSMNNLRELYKLNFRCTVGNWDMFIPFIEHGYNLLSANGVISYIVPNKLIGAKYSSSLKEFMMQFKINILRDYSNVEVFTSADVYPVVFLCEKNVVRSNQTVKMQKMATLELEKINIDIPNKMFYNDIYWDKFFTESFVEINLILKLLKFSKITEYVDIKGAATVSEAYKVKEYLEDCEDKINNNKYLKFINTGTIDRYLSLWGVKDTQYIKSKYRYPRIRKTYISQISQKRLDESLREKIIVADMNKIIEAIYDKGEFLAGKSTSIILNKENNNINLKYLLGLLNSKLLTFFFSKVFNSLSMSGGFFTIGKEQLSQLPILIPDNLYIKKIVELVDLILIGDTNRNNIEEEIDKLVYFIYNLTPEEIAIIESK
jgi:hypothetical protein